jgi:hypothetical protein
MPWLLKEPGLSFCPGHVLCRFFPPLGVWLGLTPLKGQTCEEGVCHEPNSHHPAGL